MFYLNKLADPDVMDDLSVLFENGMTLKPFVETMVQHGCYAMVCTLLM